MQPNSLIILVPQKLKYLNCFNLFQEKQPFIPKPADKPLLEVSNFELHSDRRAREREEYDMLRKQKEAELEAHKRQVIYWTKCLVWQNPTQSCWRPSVRNGTDHLIYIDVYLYSIFIHSFVSILMTRKHYFKVKTFFVLTCIIFFCCSCI